MVIDDRMDVQRNLSAWFKTNPPKQSEGRPLLKKYNIRDIYIIDTGISISHKS